MTDERAAAIREGYPLPVDLPCCGYSADSETERVAHEAACSEYVE